MTRTMVVGQGWRGGSLIGCILVQALAVCPTGWGSIGSRCSVTGIVDCCLNIRQGVSKILLLHDRKMSDVKTPNAKNTRVKTHGAEISRPRNFTVQKCLVWKRVVSGSTSLQEPRWKWVRTARRWRWHPNGTSSMLSFQNRRIGVVHCVNISGDAIAVADRALVIFESMKTWLSFEEWWRSTGLDFTEEIVDCSPHNSSVCTSLISYFQNVADLDWASFSHCSSKCNDILPTSLFFCLPWSFYPASELPFWTWADIVVPQSPSLLPLNDSFQRHSSNSIGPWW